MATYKIVSEVIEQKKAEKALLQVLKYMAKLILIPTRANW